MMRSLVNTWGLIERRGKPRRYPLHPVRRGHSLRHPQGPRRAPHKLRASGARPSPPTARAAGDHVGHRIETWARQTKHADGITWFLSKLQAEARADPDSDLEWSVPTARSDRAYNWGDSAIAPDAVGHLLHRRPSRAVSTSSTSCEPATPGESSPACVPTRATTGRLSIRTTSRRSPPRSSSLTPRRSRTPTSTPLPTWAGCRCPSSCPALPVLSRTGILGKSWRPLWEPESPRLPLSGLSAYQWDSLYHRMRQ